LRIAIAMISN